MLLGQPPRSTYFKWKKGHVAPTHDTIDLATRLGNILGILKALEILYSSPELTDRWIKEPNDAFGGRSALAHMLAGQIDDLIAFGATSMSNCPHCPFLGPPDEARLARLERTPDTSRAPSGSSVDLVLRPADGLGRVKTISGIEVLLIAHELSLLKAKRTIEAMVEHGEAIVHVPAVEDVRGLAGSFRAAGTAVKRLASSTIDVKAIRTTLGLTQEQFALRFGLEIDAVQNWEQDRCRPDKATESYLRALALRPREVGKHSARTAGAAIFKQPG